MNGGEAAALALPWYAKAILKKGVVYMLSAKIPNDVRRAVYRREHYTCAVCDDTRYLQIHHVVKRSQGGSNSLHNLVCLCSNCHALAHGMNLTDWEVTQEDVEQAIVEYMADYYAPEWNPWRKDSPPRGGEVLRPSGTGCGAQGSYFSGAHPAPRGAILGAGRSPRRHKKPARLQPGCPVWVGCSAGRAPAACGGRRLRPTGFFAAPIQERPGER